MNGLRTLAPGKINVCLFVGGVRSRDGRHELVSVMQAVGLCDDVRLIASAHDAVACDGVTGENIVTAAVGAFRAHTGREDPVAIEVVKRIPVAAGMAGGSADAGAALRLLDAHFGTDLGDRALEDLAAGLGADVPAQVRPGRHLATGAGEQVAPLTAHAPYGVVVLPHAEPLPTPAVYAAFDRLGLARPAAELEGLTARVRDAAHDLPDGLVHNDLEPAAIALCPAIATNLERMRAAGADVALVSGSGPTVLGLTRDPAAAAAVAERAGPDAIATTTFGGGAGVGPA